MASLTLTFQNAASDKDVVVELDAERNSNRTQFRFGEKAYFKVYADPAMEINVTSSDGVITTEGIGTELIEESIQAVDSRDHTTSKPITSVQSWQWYGREMGVVVKTALKTVQFAKTPAPGGENGVAIGLLKCHAPYRRYAIRVDQRDTDPYGVLVVIY